MFEKQIKSLSSAIRGLEQRGSISGPILGGKRKTRRTKRKQHRRRTCRR